MELEPEAPWWEFTVHGVWGALIAHALPEGHLRRKSLVCMTCRELVG